MRYCFLVKSNSGKVWGRNLKSVFFLFNLGEKLRIFTSQEMLGVTLFANAVA